MWTLITDTEPTPGEKVLLLEKDNIFIGSRDPLAIVGSSNEWDVDELWYKIHPTHFLPIPPLPELGFI
jgi:hypothetical protein